MQNLLKYIKQINCILWNLCCEQIKKKKNAEYVVQNYKKTKQNGEKESNCHNSEATSYRPNPKKNDWISNISKLHVKSLIILTRIYNYGHFREHFRDILESKNKLLKLWNTQFPLDIPLKSSKMFLILYSSFV